MQSTIKRARQTSSLWGTRLISKFVVSCLAAIMIIQVSPMAYATGVGDVEIRLNGGANVAYIGQLNTAEIWFMNDEPLWGMNLGFEYGFIVSYQFISIYGNHGYVNEEGDAVGCWSGGGLHTVDDIDNISPDHITIAGTCPYPWGLLPAHPSHSLCYTMAFYIPSSVKPTPNAVSVNQYINPPSYDWIFDDGTMYAPTFQGIKAPVYFDVVYPPGMSVSLSGIGVMDDDSIMCGPPFTINVRLNNTTGDTITSLSTGLKIYSPDGVTWETPVYNLAGGIEDFFDSITVEGFSLDGSGADTIGLWAGAAISGIPNGYNDIILTITTAISPEDTNKTICIDSCFFPPDGVWQWETGGGASSPDWGGPYCFGTKCYYGIYGFKYNDLNRNGQMDPGEPRMNGWSICPYPDNNPLSSPNGQCWQTYTDTHYPYGVGCFELTPGFWPKGSQRWVGEPNVWPWIQTEPDPNVNSGRFLAVLCPIFPCGPFNFGNFCPCVKAPRNIFEWFPFDEPFGPLAMNVCSGIDGVYCGNPTIATGVVGNCLCFNGSSDYVEAPSPCGDIDLGDFTVDAWIRRDINDNDGGVRTILDKRENVGSNYYGYSLYLYQGNLGFQLASGPHSNWVVSFAYVPVDEWHHVAVTVDRDLSVGGVKFYLDGAQMGLGNDPTPYQFSTLSNPGPFRVASQSFVLSSMFKGCIDEVEVFNRVLQQSEILDIYHHSLCGAGKCRHKCSVPKHRSYPWSASSKTVKVCITNLNTDGRYFTYSFQGLPATTPGCDINGPTTFTYSAPNPIWVNSGKTKCISVTMDRPAFTSFHDIACYEMCVRDMVNHQIVCCTGHLSWAPWDIAYDGPWPTFAKSDSSEIWQFEVTNLDSVAATLDYQISVIDEDFNTDTSLVSLDSLPPGTPVSGVVEDIPSGESTDLYVTVGYNGSDPLNIHSLLLQCYNEEELYPLIAVRLMTIEEPEYICGDASGDETINVADAVWIINYVFAGGAPPEPLESGDCNCDGTCNVADAVWIINYVFAGGYAPCDTNGDGEPDC